MEKFIPYEKLSKKEKRKLNLAKRQTWGERNPVTRKPENSNDGAHGQGKRAWDHMIKHAMFELEIEESEYENSIINRRK